MRYQTGTLRVGSLTMGSGSLKQAGEEAKKLIKPGAEAKALIVCGSVMGKSLAYSELVSSLEATGIKADQFAEVEPEPSMPTGQRCSDMLHEGGYSLVIGFGGGSALDVAKIASVTAGRGNIADWAGIGKIPSKGVPMLFIPTTSGSGSEATLSALLTDFTAGGIKKGFVSPYMLPDSVIIDPMTTLSLPPKSTAATGIDALIHALEAFVSRRANPVTDALALEAIRKIAANLRKAYANGDDIEAREAMAAASFMAGMSIGNAGLGLVHGMALPMGGIFGITHGIANAVLLPFVLEFNVMAAPEKYAMAAEAMGEPMDGLTLLEKARSVVFAVNELMDDIDIPRSAAEVGVPESALDDLAQHAMNNRRLVDVNPRQPSLAQIRTLFQQSWQGR
ncbi:MAG TPA: iron-containing alcohol dehydrogenase [Bacillota bacterium]|nr:iron-containing alcohol dehydrogenase [Bacillota bacterium]HOG52541.1 iron-containing alcohol dehydrogenase [Bacillota bacterium]